MSRESDSPSPAALDVAVRTSGMGIWAIDGPKGRVTLNERSCEIHGLATTSIELAFDDYLALVITDDRWKLRDVLGSATLSDFRDLEFRLADASAGARWIRLSGDVTSSSESTQLSVAGSCFDISERMHVHRQLLQAQKMEAVGQLTAGIAHNFNNILSAILPSLHLIAPHVKPEATKLVRNAQLAAERATDLVSELMVVAGRKTGQARKALDLVEIVERVVRICRTTFGGWVQLSFDCEYQVPPLLGNESQIEQVLLNLLLNARDAFEEGSTSCPRIDLELDVENDKLVLRVMDNGPGMDLATLQRVFEPFFTTKGAGTGLGLATTYAIIGEHGGTIECASKPNSGTEFVLKLPVHAGVVESVPEPMVSVFVGGCERILVVDDDSLVRQVTSAALRDAGYQVVEAKGGNEALRTQRSDTGIDLVVLDMAMPELSGDQVLAAMRSKNPAVKVLVFTGLSDARIDRLTGVAILQKPAGVNELLQAVRGAIDNRAIN
jgi:two-component system cell cycle sensor histidine kinase/response regulator CckA